MTAKQRVGIEGLNREEKGFMDDNCGDCGGGGTGGLNGNKKYKKNLF